MSLVSEVNALATRIATEINTVRTERGALTSLTTTDKASIVGAINEIAASVASASGIDDLSTGVGTSWSSQKVADEIAAAVTSILGSATAAYDTLGEIQAILAADDTETSGILTALANRVSTDAAQGLTTLQKINARNNIDVYSKTEIGDPATVFTTTFTTGLS